MKMGMQKAADWFVSGVRVSYDKTENKVVETPLNAPSGNESYQVWRKVTNSTDRISSEFISMLPGFPDGSYGWSRVEGQLQGIVNTPRLYVEYLGQGDSDKPEKYHYSTKERADLVEAHWDNLNVRTTYLVTFDYSSLVAMELLRRQQEQQSEGKSLGTTIKGVLFINGGLFADAHSHPIMTTPLLKTAFGKMGTRIAQKSHLAFNLMMKGLWSKEYGVTKAELNEVFDAVTRRNGALFMSNAAKFVDEHKGNANRWDLFSIYSEMQKDVSFHIVGSEKDQFEPNQISKAKERLGPYDVAIRMVPGGHMTTSEYPDLLAAMIAEMSQ